jgi:glutamate carboxypeptidase
MKASQSFRRHGFVPFALSDATEKKAETVRLIRRLVECESPSEDAASVNRLVDLLVEETRDIASAKTIRSTKYGKHLRLEFKLPGRKKDGQILALGHSDTVWPMGTLRSMPFRDSEGRLSGPGVLDMKSGLAFFVTAMRILREAEAPVGHKVVLLVVSDEEVGSETSRPVTEAEAQRSKFVLVLEPGTGLSGKLKTARKGVGNYSLFIEGKAAHAGVDFENGASAILEAARQIEKIAAFTNLKQGTTVNPGVMNGGTRSNVIAAQARVDVDIRVTRLSHAYALDEKLKGLKQVDKRCQLRIEGGLNRPPMERTPAIAALYGKARAIGKEMGLAIEESATGGGSDGNFTAALGIPTLDGLGGVGEGAHARNESILVDRIADRVALLAHLVGTA